MLAAQAALGRLLASHPDVDELFLLGSADELPRCDFYLPLLSAPARAWHRRRDDSLRSSLPFGRSRADRASGVGSWPESMASRSASSGKARAIIVWIVGVRFRWPILRRWPGCPACGWSACKKDLDRSRSPRSIFRCSIFAGRLDEVAGPFMDTAAVIRNLDLVVAPDTAIAHLAGALGAPVWIALAILARLALAAGPRRLAVVSDRALFRQTTLGEWHDVFDRIADAVQVRREETASSS